MSARRRKGRWLLLTSSFWRPRYVSGSLVLSFAWAVAEFLLTSFFFCCCLQDRKNALEEYIYDVREKLEGAWKKYSDDATKQSLIALAATSEDWLYTEEGSARFILFNANIPAPTDPLSCSDPSGEDATKSAYVARLDALKALGDPISLRHLEHEERPRATAQLREVMTGFADKARSGDEKYSHIDEKDLTTVIETCANAEAWLGNKLASQAEKPLNVKPVITSAEIKKKSEE